MSEASGSYRRGPLDGHAKGLPVVDHGLDLQEVQGLGWNIFDGRFLLPTMVLRRSALEHDIDLMAGYVRQRGVWLAPHGKTTMCPQIWRLQLEAGAWAITVATAWQACVAEAVGVERILIANQVVDEAGIACLGAMLDDPRGELICQADSVAGVARMAGLLGQRRRRLPVLVEVGFEGGRTGVRGIGEAEAVIAAIGAAPNLMLAGVTTFEGVVEGVTSEDRHSAVVRLLGTVRRVGSMVAAAACEDGLSEIIASGGGSVYFDTVVDELTRRWETPIPVRAVIRPGCTVTHDDGVYEATSPFGSRAAPGTPRLVAALEVWAPVLSTPDAGLALVGAGRRDLPYDAGLPSVLKVRRVDGSGVEALSGVEVTRLNDQHAFVALEPDGLLTVGDLVGFGISHPCSAFDRWRSIPVVDDEYGVVDVYETIF